jgi:cytosine permease
LIDPSVQTSELNIDLPPTLRAERDGPPFPKRPWYLGIGPAYLTIFVWAPFFDPLWMDDLSMNRLPWLAGIAVLASALCFALFFYPTAIWGHRNGRGLGVMAASTFGTAGSEWITGVGIGIAQLVWYAVAIGYAVESTLLGLVTAGIIAPDVLGSWEVGPLRLKTPVFLCTAAFWIFITGTASLLRLMAVIAALMKVYAPVALALLTGAALWLVLGPGSYFVEFALDPVAVTVRHIGGRGIPALPLFLGFFAMLGLSSVDWGAASLRRRDVTIGGLTGILLAGSWAAIMSLLVVAGALGRLSMDAGRLMSAFRAAGPPQFSFRWGIAHGIGGYPAAVILVLFGLAALAPACYSVWGFSNRLSAHWSIRRRYPMTWIGGAIALMMIAVSWSSRLDTIDHVMGLIFAPVVGALVGDLLRQRGGWAGVRLGVNPPGLVAWLVGLAIGYAGDFVVDRDFWLASEFVASPIIGFLTALIVYWLLAWIGLERPSILLGIVEAPHLPVETSGVDDPAVGPVPSEPTGSEPPGLETRPEGQP